MLFAYRETPHASTGFSPFELLFGRTPKGPLDVLQRQWTDEQHPESENVVTYLTKLYDRMEQANQIASATEKKAKEQMTEYYDRGARLTSYQVGDLVLILRPSVGQKLQARWKGPYSISKKLSDTTYMIKKDRTARRTYTYHVNMIQKYLSPTAVCLMATQDDVGDDIPCWEAGDETQDHPSTLSSQQNRPSR